MYLRRVYGKYRYYRCAKRCSPALDAGMLEELLEDKFLSDFGEDKVQERVYIQSENHQIELDQARSAVDEISSLLGTITSETVRSQLLGQISALDSRIARLELMPTREAGWESRETGETYREVWDRSNVEERRQLLINSGISARASKPEGTNALKFVLHTGGPLTQKSPPELARSQPQGAISQVFHLDSSQVQVGRIGI